MSTKISELIAATGLIDGDIFPLVQGGENKKADVSQFGGRASLLVAANDAPETIKARADYVCDGQNDEVQIQAAADDLPSVGGSVELSAGNFLCSKAGVAAGPPEGYCVYIDETHPPLNIEGQGWSTVIKMADSQDANTSLLLIGGTVATQRTNQTTIRNTKFDGNKTGQVAPWIDYAVVEARYANDLLFEGLHISDAPWACLRAFRNSMRWAVDRCYIDNTNLKTGIRMEAIKGSITRCFFVGIPAAASGNPGLDMACNSDIDVQGGEMLIQDNVFDGGFQQASLAGIRNASMASNVFVNSLAGSALSLKITPYNSANDYDVHDNIVMGNVFYNIRQGIQLEGTGVTLECYRNLISNNQITDGPDVNLANGIFETGINNDNNVIINNIIQGATAPITRVGANTVVRGNKGYVTENGGTSAAIATGGTIAHGLEETPTIVQVNAAEAGPTDITISVDATNITVNFGGGGNKTFFWSARVDP